MRCNKRKWTMIITGIFVMGIAVCGIFLPGRILTWQSNLENNLVMKVSQEQYSSASAAIARAASLNLQTSEKLQLIAGQWESTTSQIDAYEMEMEDYEAVELARKGIAELVENQYYPKEISSEYGNWFTWKATPFKAVDTTFQIYPAYYWKIDFSKYDDGAKHTIYMLEDGTIFYAMMQDTQAMVNCEMVSVFETLKLQSVYEVNNISMENMQVANCIPYEEISQIEFSWKNLTSLTAEQEVFQILQASSKEVYIWCVVPQ